MSTLLARRTSRRWFHAAISTIAAVGLTLGGVTHAEAVTNGPAVGRRVVGSAPLNVSATAVKTLGHRDADAVLSLGVGLAVRQSAELDSVIRAASTPGSSAFGRYLTRAQYRARYAPTTAQVRAVSAWLEREGATVTGISPDHLIVHVRATTAVAERAFAVTIDNYRAASRNVFANTAAPTAPATLAIDWVTGLDDVVTAKTFGSTVRPASGGTPPYIPSDFQQAYNVHGVPLDPPNVSNDETIGFTLWGAPLPQSDLDRFASDTASRRIVVGQSGSDGIDFVPCNDASCPGGSQSTDSSALDETAMDVEYAHGVAQGSHLRYWLGSTDGNGVPDVTALDNAVNAAANDPTVHVVSNSWGYGSDYSDANLNASLQEAASVGTTFFFSSGDYETIAYPATSPYVVSVGGTSLNLDSGSNYASESVWDWGGVGGGTGCSSIYARPTWQIGVDAAATCSGRAEPDVAADADPDTGAYVDVYGSSEEIGGTSLAAPLWTGMAAVWNELDHQNGRSGIGFVAPLLYTVGNNATAYAQDFHDVTVGQTGGNPALTGWDEATGWGSPNLAHLVTSQASSAPAAPTNVVAAAGDASASVTWTAPADNGSPISSYTIAASPGPASVTVGGTQTTASISNLNNGTPYTFTVRATNGVGTGQASAPSNRVTPTSGSGPAVEAPSTGFAFPGALGTVAVPAVEKWVASSDPHRICSYDLRESVRGGAFYEVALGSPTATSVAVSLNPSMSYRFELNVTNCVGVSSGWGVQPSFAPLAWQESNKRIKYNGAWTTKANHAAYGGGLRFSTTRNASASESFQGAGVAWVSETGPTRGTATVYLDGVAQKTVNLYSPTTHSRQLVWKQGWSFQSRHTITIVVSGTGGHPRVDLDGFLTFHLQ